MLDVVREFDREIPVPAVDSYKELLSILLDAGAGSMFGRGRGDDAEDEEAVKLVLNRIYDDTKSDSVGVGVKKVLQTLATSRQSRDMAEEFVRAMAALMAQNKIELEGGA